MNDRKDKNYVSPSMWVILIEAEQPVMVASTEQLGDWADDQEW